MSRSTFRLFATLLLCTLVVAAATAGGQKLRYKMANGTKHGYMLTSDTKAKTQMMGQEFATTSSNMFGISMTGEAAGANGEMVVIATIDTNLAKIDSPMMKDTARVIKEMNGKRVRLTVSGLGKTLKSEMVDKYEPSPAAQMGGGANPADLMRSLFARLPEQEVGIGDTWKHTQSDTVNAQGFNLVVKPDITFKVESAEKMGGYDCLKISFEGPSTQYGTGSRQGMELVLDGTVKTKGFAFFAPAEGLLVGLEQSSTQDVNISGSGEQQFTMVQSAVTTSKVTLTK